MSRSPFSPVWTDPDLAELLADEPELVAIADAVQQTRAAAAARRRRPWLVRLGAAAAVVLATSTAVLIVPWSRDSHAAVLDQIRSALTPRPGWIIHERAVISQIAGSGRRETIASESWTRSASSYTYRELIRTPGSRPLEEGGTNSTSGVRLAFDPATNTLYRDGVLNHNAADAPPTLTNDLRGALASGTATLAGRITLAGHTIYRIVSTTPQSDGFWVAYVEGTTFRPVRFEFSSPPPPGENGATDSSAFLMTVTTYEYLPPTASNLRLANIRTQHPAATVAAAAAMPSRLRHEIQQQVRG